VTVAGRIGVSVTSAWISSGLGSGALSSSRADFASVLVNVNDFDASPSAWMI